MLIAMEGDFTAAGYRFVMNQNRNRRDACRKPW
jgi:glutathione S-transferase